MDDMDKRPSCKIVLLGNSGVGKTSLVMKWTSGTFHRSIKPTIGANHQRKAVQVNNEEIDLYIWDTAGQEQFQSLTPLYARSAACAVVVAAIDDRESFAALEEWLKLLTASCERVPPAILAVNKQDLADHAVYTQEEIEQNFGSMFVGVFYVSASTGESVDTAFMQAAKSAYDFVKRAEEEEVKDVVKMGEPSAQGKSGCSC